MLEEDCIRICDENPQLEFQETINDENKPKHCFFGEFTDNATLKVWYNSHIIGAADPEFTPLCLALAGKKSIKMLIYFCLQQIYIPVLLDLYPHLNAQTFFLAGGTIFELQQNKTKKTISKSQHRQHLFVSKQVVLLGVANTRNLLQK